MESLLTLFFICVLCIFVYGYITMSYKYRSYPQKCNVLYIPEHDEETRIKSPYTEVIDHVSHENDNIESVMPPQPSIVESLYPPVNQIHDRSIFVELVP
jgi:hypothetical protein